MPAPKSHPQIVGRSSLADLSELLTDEQTAGSGRSTLNGLVCSSLCGSFVLLTLHRPGYDPQVSFHTPISVRALKLIYRVKEILHHEQSLFQVCPNPHELGRSGRPFFTVEERNHADIVGRPSLRLRDLRSRPRPRWCYPVH